MKSTQHSTFQIAVAFLLVFSSVTFAQEPPVTAIAFSPDGKSVVACSQAGLKVYDWPDLNLQTTIKTAAANLHCLAFSADGKRLAVGGGNPSEEGIVEVFSWPQGKSLKQRSGHGDSVTSLAWLASEKLASASLDREVKLWDLANQDSSVTLKGHSRGVSAVCILRDGTIVTAGDDQSLRVWNGDSGNLIRSLNQHTKPIHAMAVCPQQEGLPTVATAAGDRTIRFWQPTIGRMMRFVRLDSEPLAIAWVSESQIVASCVDGQARVVDSDNVKVVQTLPAIKGWAYAIAVHPADGSLVVGGSDGQLRRIVTDKSPTR